MTIEEKLHLIETIWEQISVDEKQLEVPQSHKKMLDKRLEMTARGETEFLDWEQAKKQISKATQ
ncbi:MAG: addiction module protein [Balneolaceae bacterium]